MCWLQPHQSVDLLLFCFIALITEHLFWTVGWTKQNIWRRHLGLFTYDLSINHKNIQQVNW